MNPPAPSCRSTGNGKGEGFFALSLSLLPQAGTQGGERRTPPGVRGFRFFRARESNAYGAENGQGGDGPALFRIRERKSPSGVLTNPSFPCKMKGVPDAVRAAGGRFSARSLSPYKGGRAARCGALRRGSRDVFVRTVRRVSRTSELSYALAVRRGRASAGQAAARLSAGRKTECASYASAAQSDGMLL